LAEWKINNLASNLPYQSYILANATHLEVHSIILIVTWKDGIIKLNVKIIHKDAAKYEKMVFSIAFSVCTFLFIG
jgi:hypothetical protein